MYKAIFADEAIEQLNNLDKVSRNKILRGIRTFEAEGKNARNSRDGSTNIVMTCYNN